jgi:osmotically-inducible protein OsmY
MGWFERLFPHHDAAAAAAEAPAGTDTDAIPPERRGPEGTYDQSGLAKRVVQAFDQQGVEDAPHVYVAQTGTTVVFKGNVHSQEIIDQLATIARGVDGAQDVDTSAVHIA